MRTSLATLIDDFRRTGRDIAVVRYQGNRRRVTTYAQLASLAGRFATLLVQRGIGPGDRVLIWGESSAEWIAVFHGCLLRGVLAVPLDAAGAADFAARVAADVSPKLAVGDMVLLSPSPASMRKRPLKSSSPPAPPANQKALSSPTATSSPALAPSKSHRSRTCAMSASSIPSASCSRCP